MKPKMNSKMMFRADIFTQDTQETNTGWIECDSIEDFMVKVIGIYEEDVEFLSIKDVDGNEYC